MIFKGEKIIKNGRVFKVAAVFFVAMLVFVSSFSFAFADSSENPKTVKVGFFQTTNFLEENEDTGFKSGYAYEYIQKIASYANWNIEYCSGTWNDLYQMLEDGEIDVLPGVLKSEEREEIFNFPDEKMGTETHNIYKRSDDNSIISSDVNSFSGKKIGVLKNNIMTSQYEEWSENNASDIKEISFDDFNDRDEAIKNSNVDMIVASDITVTSEQNITPVQKIGESDYYLATSELRDDLKDDINSAMSKILKNDPTFIDDLSSKYYGNTIIYNAQLSDEEKSWIEEHKDLNIGVVNDFLPFSDVDEGNGKGLINDVMLTMLDNLGIKDNLTLNYHGFDTYDEMIDALKDGTIDVIFPVPTDSWYLEEKNIIGTKGIVESKIEAVYKDTFNESTTDKIAVSAHSSIQKEYIEYKFPDSEIVECESGAKALDAVVSGKAGCVFFAEFRAEYFLKSENYRNLKRVDLQDSEVYCFAVKKEDKVLLSILDGAISSIDSDTINTSLISNAEELYTYNIRDFIADNLNVVGAVVAFVIIIIVLMALYFIRKIKRKNNELLEANKSIERAEQETRTLLHEMERDNLTGIYTREAFFHYAEELIKNNPDKDFDVFVASPNHFQIISNIYGVEASHKLIKYLADCIGDSVKHGIYGRFSGDTFIAIIEHRGDVVLELMKKRAREISNNSPIPGVIIKYGIYKKIDRNTSILICSDRAVLALKSIEENRNELIASFDGPINKKQIEEKEIESAFDDALKNDEFTVYFQPKFSNVTDQIVGAEALVRWIKKDGTFVSPGIFVPVLEKTGRIRELDKKVFELVLKHQKKQKENGMPVVPVSINLSRISLYADGLAEEYIEIAREYDVSPEIVPIEITESATEEDGLTIKVTEKLAEEGFSIHMDDFGSGYSSLADLGALHIEVIKLDKSLVDQIGNKNGEMVLRYTVDMAKELGLKIVAEGVENIYQVNFLKKIGVEVIQGYFYSKPLKEEDFINLLNKK